MFRNKRNSPKAAPPTTHLLQNKKEKLRDVSWRAQRFPALYLCSRLEQVEGGPPTPPRARRGRSVETETRRPAAGQSADFCESRPGGNPTAGPLHREPPNEVIGSLRRRRRPASSPDGLPRPRLPEAALSGDDKRTTSGEKKSKTKQKKVNKARTQFSRNTRTEQNKTRRHAGKRRQTLSPGGHPPPLASPRSCLLSGPFRPLA